MILSIGLQYGLFYYLSYRTSTPARSFACNVLHSHRVLIHRYTHKYMTNTHRAILYFSLQSTYIQGVLACTQYLRLSKKSSRQPHGSLDLHSSSVHTAS
jgi:hypothetical protein